MSSTSCSSALLNIPALRSSHLAVASLLQHLLLRLLLSISGTNLFVGDENQLEM